MSQLNRTRPLILAAVVACVGLLIAPLRAQERPRDNSNSTANLQREVNHQLTLLPFLTVFDNLQFQVNGDTVILSGEVTQPNVKRDAEKAVKGIEGVNSITNNIEVLPLSPDDVKIRRAEFHAIYGDPNLELYATGTQQPIHIIVKGGHVTLLGFVKDQMDKQIVENRAKSVGSVFSVDNQLQIQPRT